MIDRRIFVAVALAAPLALPAQTGAKVWRVGALGLDPLTPGSAAMLGAFHAGMRELGYVENRDYSFERRHAGGQAERLPTVAAELVASGVDLILAPSTLIARSAKNATATIPIVLIAVSDPVVNGLVASMARPGGNLTGVGDMEQELDAKRVELLRDTVPSLARLAVLWNPDFPTHPLAMSETEAAARRLKLHLLPVELRRPQDLDAALERIEKMRPDGLVVISQVLLVSIANRLFEAVARLRVPTAGGATYARAGALLSYGVSYIDLFRRAAWYVDKIFRGAKPAEMPIEQPTKFELIINLKTAKAIGLTIPQWLLLRADEVIQ